MEAYGGRDTTGQAANGPLFFACAVPHEARLNRALQSRASENIEDSFKVEAENSRRNLALEHLLLILESASKER